MYGILSRLMCILNYICASTLLILINYRTLLLFLILSNRDARHDRWTIRWKFGNHYCWWSSVHLLWHIKTLLKYITLLLYTIMACHKHNCERGVVFIFSQSNNRGSTIQLKPCNKINLGKKVIPSIYKVIDQLKNRLNHFQPVLADMAWILSLIPPKQRCKTVTLTKCIQRPKSWIVFCRNH